ncbi:MAG: 1-deoxy-D-xylulose 5-phosphate reductoisomerase, 1-deoxy-D-xylulose-5-phosphate reductoisomerase [Candidatus Peregrinibacteria bacterium GW2011_GWF2_39_17]|nr:MAG: 1-deoxy-D-xylulose 5-phosphate reductoisomerase, 1-deoxy-D-xylulose-5-phosphate reductoisomerase [Candidatus Peregrinibacteria bacterium GW2011_GWF2_39_17]HCW32417.1 1-deoxy-D-xylulose-5-phosphate reductoisomerase [Candidatus Peregrinibacteria bacterium]
MARKKILILGSTGSIGIQALEVIRLQPDDFEIVGLSSYRNEKLLRAQAAEFRVKETILAEGTNLASFIAGIKADLALVAISGSAGLIPTLAAIESGKNIALANKESLVMKGREIMTAAKLHKTQLIPVDSEHSALFQLLQKVPKKEVLKIILTCSGGPFWRKTKEELEKITVKDALKHPTWKMGKEITINSATLVNKGFEIIEAHHLFGFDYEQIEVLIHPQSLVHAMVQLKDGNTLMHYSPPNMQIPISYALNYPNRHKFLLENVGKRSPGPFLPPTALDFFPPQKTLLKGIELGYQIGRLGGDNPEKFVRTNEKAVRKFLEGKISFLEIYTPSFFTPRNNEA